MLNINQDKNKLINDLLGKMINKNKGKLVFNLNVILDYFYKNELINFVEVSTKHIETISSFKGVDLYLEVLQFIASYQKDVDFYKNFYKFIEHISDQGNIDIFTLEKALKNDIQLVFVNGVGNVKKNSMYIDDVINKFYSYLSNTLFRNFVVIYINMFVKEYKHSDIATMQSFLLDILCNNRKINTIIGTNKFYEGGLIIYPILTLLLSKINIKGSSLFSNQLRFFGYRRIKFIKDKEQHLNMNDMSFNKDVINKTNEINNLYQSFGFKKAKDFIGVLDNIKELFDTDLDYDNRKQNLCEILLTNFKGDKEKINLFLTKLKDINEKLHHEMIYYLSDVLDYLEEKLNEKK